MPSTPKVTCDHCHESISDFSSGMVCWDSGSEEKHLHSDCVELYFPDFQGLVHSVPLDEFLNSKSKSKSNPNEKLDPKLSLDLLKEKLPSVESLLLSHYDQNILNQIKIGFAVAATTLLQDCAQPISLFYVGNSGSSKTLTCNLLTPDSKHSSLRKRIIRVDKFTPKSFVSHAANVKAEVLAKIDLLPKLKNRCLVTKELAPVFRGRIEDLEESFSILISVLDGKGYVSTSGIRGMRGYDEDIFFSWLGATTPLSNRVHRLMAQLGTRVVFYNTETKQKSISELVTFAQKQDNRAAERESHKICGDYLKTVFDTFEVESIPETFFRFPGDLLLDLVQHVQLMCSMRAGFSMSEGKNGESRFSRPDRETEYRAIIIFKNLAYALALIHGRCEVSPEDLEYLHHVAYSSMPEQRRLIFQALVSNQGRLEVGDVINLVGMSKPTALHYMEELSHLGICSFEKGGLDHSPSEIVLHERWNWLLSAAALEERKRDQTKTDEVIPVEASVF